MKLSIILTTTLLLVDLLFYSQRSPLMEMVNAEKSFAAYAASAGITPAFMKYLDDSARVFEGGQILYGKDVWKERKTDSMELKWYPEFAEVAVSGDFGYTTGPSEFRVRKGSENADQKGYFHSIWKKNGNGEWKVILDMGTRSSQSEYDESKVEYIDKEAVLNKKKKKTRKSDEYDIKKVEESFIANYNDGKGYLKYGSAAMRYYRPGYKVVKTGASETTDTLRYSYKNTGTGMARSGDMAYAYGYVEVSGKTGNYLRVWKKDADVWNIVLDAATY